MTQGGWLGSGDAGRVRAQPAADPARPPCGSAPRGGRTGAAGPRSHLPPASAGLRHPPPRPSATAGPSGKLLGPLGAGGGGEERGGGVDRAGSRRARRGGELRTEEPPPPARGWAAGAEGAGAEVAGDRRCQLRRRSLFPANARFWRPHPSPPHLPGAAACRPRGHPSRRPPSPRIWEPAATRDPEGSPGLPEPPAPALGSVRAGGSRSPGHGSRGAPAP